MNVVIVGQSAHAASLSNMLGERFPTSVEHYTRAEHAVLSVRRSPRTVDWVLVDGAVERDTLVELRALLDEAGNDGAMITAVDAVPEVSPARRPMTATGDDTDDVERWRNVLSFASHRPDDYPALRDALRDRPGIVQFHAPCKRSA